MRFLNSLRNSTIALAGQIVTILLGFVTRWFFIRCVGQDYLGVNGLMESVLTILSMTELGIGTSVAFALYKPIEQGDERKISALMGFYRRTYYLLGISTLLLGLLFFPIIRLLVPETGEMGDFFTIYLIFLLNSAVSYFFSYQRTLLSAYQQNYINSLCEDIAAVGKYLLQIAVLAAFHSYIGYLLINAGCALLVNILIARICDRKYTFVRAHREERLSPEDKTALRRSVISLMYQKIGAKLVTGTDNLMISYAKLSLMGIYSNYSMVISVISRVVYNVLHAMVGSLGSLMAQEDRAHQRAVFDEFVFATFSFYFLIAIGLSACLERFIVWWAGSDWLLSPMVTFLVILNFFLTGMRQPNIIVIEAAGLFYQMRLKAVLEVVVNLVVSFLFLVVFQMGIYGVLFGTTISMVSVCIWWEILVVHRYALMTSPRVYTLRLMQYLLTAAVGCALAYALGRLIPVQGFLGLCLSGCAAVALFGVILLLFYRKSTPFQQLSARIIGGGKRLWTRS